MFGGSLGARRSTAPSTGWPRAGAGGPTSRSTTSSADGTAGATADAEPSDGSPRHGPGRRRARSWSGSPYEERDAAVYAAADVVVCRAGAIDGRRAWPSVGVPAVLVPLPARPATTRRPTPGCWRASRRGGRSCRRRVRRRPAGRRGRRAAGRAGPAGGHGRAAARPGPTRRRRGRCAGLVEAARPARCADVTHRRRDRPGDRTCRSPVRVHVVGVGGAGHERHRHRARRHGPRGDGQRPRELGGDSSASGRSGSRVAVGHDAAHVGDADAGHRLDAVPAENPEVAEARRRGIPVLDRAEALAGIAAPRRCVAVAGTHGKTTTSSMLALILVEAGLHPSFLIGGDVNEIGTNAVWDARRLARGRGRRERRHVPRAAPRVAVVTNVEADHLDHYGRFDALRTAFDAFLARRRPPGGRCATTTRRRARPGASAPLSSGLGDRRHLPHDRGRDRAAARSPSTCSGPTASLAVHLAVAGARAPQRRNAAVAAVAAAGRRRRRSTPPRAALARFAGVARRFEYRGEVDGVTFVDDYAHLPTEVRGRPRGRPRRRLGPGRGGLPAPPLHAGPRRWRAEFADAFDDADVLVRDRHLRRRGGARCPG